MDKLNKLADKVDRAAEKIVNRIEDEIDNSQDKPIEPMSAGLFFIFYRTIFFRHMSINKKTTSF